MFFPGNPLNYPTNSLSSIRRYLSSRAPTTLDIKNFNLGDEWLDESAELWYKLASKQNNVADWCVICNITVGDLTLLVPDSGTSPVVPDGSNEITLTGGAGISTEGTGANELTVEFTGTLFDGLAPDAGTSPVVPDVSNEIEVIGGTAISTEGTAASELTIDFTGTLFDGLLPDSGTSPVVPDVSNEITLSGGTGISTEGTGSNELTVEFTGTLFDGLVPDSGTSPVVPDGSNEITIVGGTDIETVGTSNTLTINFTGSTSITGFIPDSGTSPVVPDGSGEITIAGSNGITTVGGTNLLTIEMTGSFEGDFEFTCPSGDAAWNWDCTAECTTFKGIDTGFTGSEWITCQAGVQTTDATLTTIASVSLSDLMTSTVRATFSGARSDHSAALSGDIIYGARRSGGGTVEMSPPISNILSDGGSGVTIDADVSGNDIILTVTGESATTWNWVVTYEYQILDTNS